MKDLFLLLIQKRKFWLRFDCNYVLRRIIGLLISFINFQISMLLLSRLHVLVYSSQLNPCCQPPDSWVILSSMVNVDTFPLGIQNKVHGSCWICAIVMYKDLFFFPIPIINARNMTRPKTHLGFGLGIMNLIPSVLHLHFIQIVVWVMEFAIDIGKTSYPNAICIGGMHFCIMEKHFTHLIVNCACLYYVEITTHAWSRIVCTSEP